MFTKQQKEIFKQVKKTLPKETYEGIKKMLESGATLHKTTLTSDFRKGFQAALEFSKQTVIFTKKNDPQLDYEFPFNAMDMTINCMVNDGELQ